MVKTDNSYLFSISCKNPKSVKQENLNLATEIRSPAQAYDAALRNTCNENVKITKCQEFRDSVS